MEWYEYLFGAVLVVISIIITVVVLLQQDRAQTPSSAIMGGGGESAYGKAKGRTVEGKLARLTKFLIALFFVIVLAAFLVFLFV